MERTTDEFDEVELDTIVDGVWFEESFKSISFGICVWVLALGWCWGWILIFVVEVDISDVRCGVILAPVLCIDLWL